MIRVIETDIPRYHVVSTLRGDETCRGATTSMDLVPWIVEMMLDGRENDPDFGYDFDTIWLAEADGVSRWDDPLTLLPKPYWTANS